MPSTARPATTQYSSASSTSSTDSDSSFRLSMETRPVASVEVLRCLRCSRHVETTSTDDVTSMGMIRVGFNLYYCTKMEDGVRERYNMSLVLEVHNTADVASRRVIGHSIAPHQVAMSLHPLTHRWDG
ncbi:hypothetical protein F5Y08DRAFT_337529 [Xylaria arbuscula]|nr:hypothetical protein F5Y08DRAFT_337529 [Xylaria arbuscula]